MNRIGIDLKIIATVAMVLISLSFMEIKGKSSGGFRGNVMETIRKSRPKIVHTIEVKVTGQSEVSLLRLQME